MPPKRPRDGSKDGKQSSSKKPKRLQAAKEKAHKEDPTSVLGDTAPNGDGAALYDLAGLKTQPVSATDCRFTFSKRMSLMVCARSRLGVQEGRTSQKRFLRLEAERKKAKTFALFEASLKKIEDYTKGAYGALKETIRETFLWEEEKGEPTLEVGCGLAAAEDESARNHPEKLVLCIFPGKWTRVYKQGKDAKVGERTAININHLIQASGNSVFVASLYANTTEFSYNSETHTVSGFTFINVGSLTFVDQGQDVNAYQEEEAAQKKAIEVREASCVASLLSSIDV